MMLEYSRVRKGVHPPERANPSDAGLDLFFNPEDGDSITIEPGTSAVLPTGCRFGVPHGYMLEIKNKSGIASKRGLLVGACVVDRGYTGEVFVNIHNPSDRTQTIHAGDKIAQAVFVKITTDISLIESEYIYDEGTSRGAGALGSTGDR